MKLCCYFLIACCTSAACGWDNGERTTCNPLMLPNYPVGMWCRGAPNGSTPTKPLWRVEKTEQYRELADPTLLIENGEYWLFPSCGGAWKSKDCANWEHVDVTLGAIGYAPTVVRHSGMFYAIGSDSPVYEADRLEGPWREIGRLELPPGSPMLADPMLFSDEGKLYLYWGCSPKGGIWGGEVVLSEKKSKDARYKVTNAKELVPATPLEDEWMRTPYDKSVAWMEGAWMVKIGSKYALTYSASGTESATYAMGVAYADSPIGDFVVAKDNPFFKKTQGVVTGTGHGSIVKGHDGKWRIVYCVAVGARHGFERVIGMDVLNVNEAAGRILKTEPTDTPHFPNGRSANWRVLSPAKVSPACDSSLATAEEVSTGRLEIPFDVEYCLRAVRIIWRDVGLDDASGTLPGPYRYSIEALADGKWHTVVDASRNKTDLMVDYRETPRTENVSALRLHVVAAPIGIRPAVAELTAFGE